jgi:hypothetical protein
MSSIKPCKNTARNITKSTANILQEEFIRGAKITEQIIHDKDSWSNLYILSPEPSYLPKVYPAPIIRPTSALRLLGKPALSRTVPVKLLDMGISTPPEIAGLTNKPSA